MHDQLLLERIACDPKIMVGKPVIKGTRLTVEYILNLLARSSTMQDILKDRFSDRQLLPPELKGITW